MKNARIDIQPVNNDTAITSSVTFTKPGEPFFDLILFCRPGGRFSGLVNAGSIGHDIRIESEEAERIARETIGRIFPARHALRAAA